MTNDELQFWVDGSRWNKFIGLLMRGTGRLVGRPAFPVKYKTGNKRVSLVRLGQAAGFDGPEVLDLLSYHDRRFLIQALLGGMFSLLFSLPLFFVALYYFFTLLDDIPVHRFGRNGWLVAAPLYLIAVPALQIFFLLIIQGSAIRLSDLLVGRLFADTLCVEAVLSLLLILGRDDVLKYSARRKELLTNINYLSRMTLLLGGRYAIRSESNHAWVFRHFKEMELYVHERARWSVAPDDSTLDNLRRDFRALAPIYITGLYGDFEWRNLYAAPERPHGGLLRRALTNALRFVGLVLPLVLMGFYLLRPDKFPFIPKESSKIITLIFISWLLLVLDSSLKLGVVAQLTGLAKGIKDLK